jgi:hypothetical protein
MSTRFRPRRLAVAAGVITAVVAAPIAVASTVQGGVRNPVGGSNLAYSQSTQIIAATPGFGTRLSNKGTGGGAIYGCRSTIGGPACVEADNLNNGLAFDFIGKGTVGGTIHMSSDKAAPFTTNATGVATGLNANFLQGKQASAFLGATAQAADSAKLGGVAASGYVQTSQLPSQLSTYATQTQLMFAVVTQNGSLGVTRGATASLATSATSYKVTFGNNVSKCAYTASPTGAALTSGSIGVAPDTGSPTAVDVTAPAALPQGFNLQVIC